MKVCEQRSAGLAALNQSLSQPLSAGSCQARGSTESSRNTPLWSLIWPSVSIIATRRAEAVADSMQLRVQSAFGAPDTSQKSHPDAAIESTNHASNKHLMDPDPRLTAAINPLIAIDRPRC